MESFQGPPRGRGRGRGGGGRGRGGSRVSHMVLKSRPNTDPTLVVMQGGNDARGPPPGQRPGFSKEQTEFGTAFYSESFFENPWAALESKA